MKKLYENRNVVIRESVIEDVDAIKDRLREADVQEVIASGFAVEEALRASFARSTLRYTVDLDGSPVAMFGIVPETILGRAAQVWLLGCPELSRIRKSFVRLSRHMIGTFLSQYPVLWNLVDSRYIKAISWLKSCGAEFGDKSFTVSGVEFLPFTIRRA